MYSLILAGRHVLPLRLKVAQPSIAPCLSQMAVLGESISGKSVKSRNGPESRTLRFQRVGDSESFSCQFPYACTSLLPERIRILVVLAPNATLRAQFVPTASNQVSAPSHGESETPSASTPGPLSWAQLLKRVIAIDMTVCFQC